MQRETFVSRYGGLLLRLRSGKYGKYELRADVTVKFENGRIAVVPAVAAAMRQHYLYGKEFWAEAELQKKAQQAMREASSQAAKEESTQIANDAEEEPPTSRVKRLYQALVKAGEDPAELQDRQGRISPAKVIARARKRGIS